MNLLDWALVVLLLAYAVSGYWQGFISGAFATVGLVLGGLLGIWISPHLLGGLDPSVGVSLLAVFVVLICASIGQASLQYFGGNVRDAITWQPARSVDAVGGAALSVVAVLVVTWMLGVAVSGSNIPGVANLVRNSAVLSEVDGVMPASAQGALRSFNNVVGDSFFPSYLEPFARERIVEVGPAGRRVLRDPDIQRAQKSVFKIRGNNKCGQGVEGSGFLYNPERVMTNAHVVAGVSDPRVVVDGELRRAEVVYYDSDSDVAVLEVPSLQGPFLRFSQAGKRDQVGAALGYPEDGPYDAQPARIRAEQRLRSPDIYGDSTVTRQVFSVRGVIRPGNSGGPLVSTAGRVLGVVFAASVSDDDTGYALTAGQVRTAAAQGISSDDEVSTGDCA
ncbi:serine protease [Marmoricola endophyticus]|uniref:Serine protease n=1 Tax=Marmoricola endophyticus TaxID=2040280 RepID=A0A917F6T8_9ACTN|nr:MarP family serine protease [Marmoricola endophyticus]GGF49401.1 serine protease [Marmoricola endophyticus]